MMQGITTCGDQPALAPLTAVTGPRWRKRGSWILHSSDIHGGEAWMGQKEDCPLLRPPPRIGPPPPSCQIAALLTHRSAPQHRARLTHCTHGPIRLRQVHDHQRAKHRARRSASSIYCTGSQTRWDDGGPIDFFSRNSWRWCFFGTPNWVWGAPATHFTNVDISIWMYILFYRTFQIFKLLFKTIYAIKWKISTIYHYRKQEGSSV
jgi:hypothetical protein